MTDGQKFSLLIAILIIIGMSAGIGINKLVVAPHMEANRLAVQAVQVVPIPKLESAVAECDNRGMGFAMKMDDYSLYCHDRTTMQVYYFNLRRE